MKEGGFRSAPGEISSEQRKKIAETRLRRRAEQMLRPSMSWEQEVARLGGDVPVRYDHDPSDPEGWDGRRGQILAEEGSLRDAYGDPVWSEDQLEAVRGMRQDRPAPTLRSGSAASPDSSGVRLRAPSVEYRALAPVSPRSPDAGRRGVGLPPNPFSDGNDPATQEAVAWMDHGHERLRWRIEDRRWDAHRGTDPEHGRPTLRSAAEVPEAPDTEEDVDAAAAEWDADWEGGEDPGPFRRFG